MGAERGHFVYFSGNAISGTRLLHIPGVLYAKEDGKEITICIGPNNLPENLLSMHRNAADFRDNLEAGLVKMIEISAEEVDRLIQYSSGNNLREMRDYVVRKFEEFGRMIKREREYFRHREEDD